MVALLHRRQDSALLVLLLRIFRFRFPRAVHRAPARRALCTAARAECFAVIGELDLRLIIDIVRTELRDVGARNQPVDIPLRLVEPHEVYGHGRRDDRMVRRDLRIVPRTRFLRRIRFLRPYRKFRTFERGEIAKDFCRILMLAHGQILRIRARISRQLLLIQLLRRIENLLRLIAVPLARKHLQRRQRKRERRRLLLLSALVACDLPVLGVMSKGVHCGTRCRLVR